MEILRYVIVSRIPYYNFELKICIIHKQNEFKGIYFDVNIFNPLKHYLIEKICYVKLIHCL